MRISLQDWHRGELEDQIEEEDRRKIKAEELKKHQVQMWCENKHQWVKN